LPGNRISYFSRLGQPGVPVSHPLALHLLHSERLAPPDAKPEDQPADLTENTKAASPDVLA